MREREDFSNTGFLLGSVRTHAGVDGVRAIIKAYGGTTIYVAMRPKPSDWLVKLIGEDAASKVRKDLMVSDGETGRIIGQFTVLIPLGRNSHRQQAQDLIETMLLGGCDVRDIVLAASTTERTVYRCRASLIEAGLLDSPPPKPVRAKPAPRPIGRPRTRPAEERTADAGAQTPAFKQNTNAYLENIAKAEVLFKNGLSPDAIADQLEKSLPTIYSYRLFLVDAGKLEPLPTGMWKFAEATPLILQGVPTRQIARKLAISESTVLNYRKRLLAQGKLGLAS